MLLPQESRNSYNNPYAILGIPTDATEEQIVHAYNRLHRIWSPKSLKKWSEWTKEQPREIFCKQIFEAIHAAFVQLAPSRAKKREVILNFLTAESLSYKQEIEEQYARIIPEETITTSDKFSTQFPDLLQYQFRFLDLTALVRLSEVSRKMYKLTNNARWTRVVGVGDLAKLGRYAQNFSFYPKSLDQTFQPKLENAHDGLARFLRLNGYVGDYSDQGPLQCASPENFQSMAAFNAYSYSHPLAIDTDLFTNIEMADEQNVTVSDVLSRDISTFQALTFSTFASGIYQHLDRMVAEGSILPKPFKTRNDFRTTSAYFEYLNYHVHDLYITLRTTPELINVQDEHGKTLLFYTIHTAKVLPKDRVEWLVHILLSTPNINMSLVDNKGDTFLHETTRHCADDFKNKLGITSAAHHLLFSNVFLPFVEYATNHNFDFRRMNNEGEAIIHIAACQKSKARENTSTSGSEDVNPIFSLLYYDNTNIDPNQLSSQGFTPLLFALEYQHTKHIEELLRVSKFDQPESRRVLGLLCNMIRFESIKLKKACASTEHAKFAQLEIAIAKIRQYHRYFLRIVSKIEVKPIISESESTALIQKKTITAILEKYKKISTLRYYAHNAELRQSIDQIIDRLKVSEKRMNILFNMPIDGMHKVLLSSLMGSSNIFILDMPADLVRKIFQNYPNCFTDIFLEVIQEEAERILLEVSTAVEPYLEKRQAFPDTDPQKNNNKSIEKSKLQEAKEQLQLQLIKLKFSPQKDMTEKLAKDFNALSENLNIRESNVLFSFLLGYRDETKNKWASAWSECKDLNWPKLITLIRTNALVKAKTASSKMGLDALLYLEDCSTLQIFTEPSGWVEQYRKTGAVQQLLNLKSKLEAEYKATLMQPK